MAGRPREFDRDHALRKARDLFWQYGYEGTSMSSLVEALGIASARIYAAFGSKEQLFKEAVQQYQSELGSFANKAFSKGNTIRQSVEILLRQAIAIYTHEHMGCMVVSSGVACSRENQNIADWLSDMRQTRTNMLIEKMEYAKKSGDLPSSVNAIAFADLCSTIIHGFSVQTRDGVDEKRLNDVVDLVMQNFDRCCVVC